MSILVYQWLKTYVPKDALKCPDGTSVFIKDYYYDCTGSNLTITIKNNGKFSVDGIFIHVSNSSDSNLAATIDISSKITLGGNVSGSSVRFSEEVENSLTPAEISNTRAVSFNVAGYGRLYKVEIMPIRMQEYENKKRIVSCGDAKIEEALTCD